MTEVLILAAAIGFQLLDKAPNGDPLFEGPVAVRCHSNGNIFVTDDIGHRILVFDHAGRVQRTLGTHGAGAGQLLSPDAVHWDDEWLYVADAGGNRIQVWTYDGRHHHDIGRHPRWRRALGPGLVLAATVLLSAFLAVALVPAWRQTGASLILLLAAIAAGSAAAFVIYGTFGGLRNPRDVLVGPDGLVYVADFNGHTVRVFSRHGELVRSIGSSGPSAGRLAHPLGLAFSADGLLFVTDSDHHRVQVFEREGRPVKMFGRRGSGAGEFMHPHGIAIGADGLIYVADRGNRRIQVWDPAGTVVEVVRGDEEPQSFTPAGIATCNGDHLLIADLTGHRVVAQPVDVTRDAPGANKGER